MNIDKAIKIRCGGEIYVSLSELHFFQKKLKSINEKDFKKLKQSLIKEGLPLGFHIWWNPKKSHWDIADGHHRYLALTELEKEGWFVPPVPCSKVIAKDRKEAARIVLISNSRYARMNEESLAEFMIDFELSVPDLEFLDFADIDFEKLGIDENFEEGDENDQGKLDELSPKIVSCPHCGESFDVRKTAP